MHRTETVRLGRRVARMRRLKIRTLNQMTVRLGISDTIKTSCCLRLLVWSERTASENLFTTVWFVLHHGHLELSPISYLRHFILIRFPLVPFRHFLSFLLHFLRLFVFPLIPFLYSLSFSYPSLLNISLFHLCLLLFSFILLPIPLFSSFRSCILQ